MPSENESITATTWLIAGAGRGMGVDLARAAPAAGHNVVATGRNPDSVKSAVGARENLLVAPDPAKHRELSTSPAHAEGRGVA